MVATWAERDWQGVECQVRGFDWSEGADRALGVLSAAAGGSWSAELYDPTRELDPSNPTATFARAVQPGQRIRFGWSVAGTGAAPIGTGVIDSAAYEVATGLARLRGSDAVGVVAGTEIAHPARPELGVATDALHELARRVILDAALPVDFPVTVEADPIEGPVTIGRSYEAPTDEMRVLAWQTITEAARDALHMAWIDRDAVIRFAPFDDPPDVGIIFGCEGVPLVSFGTGASLDGIVNRVHGRDTILSPDDPQVREAPSSLARHGARALDNLSRVLPDFPAWADAVLSDRAFAGLQLLPLQAWPTDVQQLEDVFAAPMLAEVRIRADTLDPPVELDGLMVARGVHVDPDGWGLDVVAYLPAAIFEGGIESPVPPEEGPWHTDLRVSDANRGAWLRRTASNEKQGAGASTLSPVGREGDVRSRMLVKAPVDWSGLVIGVESAVLRMWTSDEVHGTFGPQPRIRVRRITSDWTQGAASTPTTGNAVTWPGPSVTSGGEGSANVPTGHGAQFDVDVTRIVRAWLPADNGGPGNPNYGFQVRTWVEDQAYRRTELHTDDAGASVRPELRVIMRVLD